MARIFKVILFFTAVFFATLFTVNLGVRKVYAEEVWGSHAYCWANKTIFDLIWSTYGGNDWYPVTVMIGVDGNGVANLQTLFANATSGGKKLYPILRLTSQGGANWSKINPTAAATMLNSVTPAGFPGPIYVSFGNETHMANEWDGATDPSPEYGDFFRTFASAMAGNSNYVVGHAAANLSFPPGEVGEGWSTEEGPGDRAERFYSSVAGKGAGSFSGSRVLFSNPYELGSVPFPDDPGIPGTAYRAGTILNIPEHVDIDKYYNSQQGGSNTPNIWMEFGKHPGAPIGERQAFLEQAYAASQTGYRGLGPKSITPMLMSDVEKYIVVFKDAGGVAYIQCSGTNCGDEICAGGLASNNPTTLPNVITGPIEGGGTPPVEPSCVDGKYQLTIKATIKSKNTYLYGGIDPLTNKPIYTPYVYGTQSDAPMVNNLPVYHATIQVHNSVRESSVDTKTGQPFTYTHPYNSGLLDGMLKQSYASVKSKADGTFTITATSKCTDVYRADWKGTGYEQFLSVSCPDEQNGKKSLYSKNNYGMILNIPANDERGVINYGDIVVDCDPDPEAKFGSFAVNSGINEGGTKYMQRNRDVYMACTGTRVLGSTTLAIGESHNWNQGVKFVDEWGDPGGDKAIWWDIIRKWAEDQLGMVFPFGTRSGAKTETRIELINNDYDLSQLSTNIDLYTGIKGGAVERANYFLNTADATVAGADTYNGHEEKPKVYTCEEIKRCNTSLGSANYPNDNMQTCGGTAFNLASPFGGLVKDSVGNAVWEQSEYIPRYLSTNKDREICTLGTQKIKIIDIMPPEGFCGDVDRNGTTSASEAVMPCPEFFACGDYNDDGVVSSADGERDCSTVRAQNSSLTGYENAGRYKLDIRYFPYFAMFSSTTEPYAEAETRRTYTQSDLPHSMDFRGCTAEEKYIPISVGDSTNISRPMHSSACTYKEGDHTFYTQEQVKYPGFKDNQTNYSTTVNLAQTGLNAYTLPFMAVGTPQFISSTNPRELLDKAVLGMKSTISATTNGNFYRIGVPDNLCSCSMVETTGSTGLGNCQTEKGDQLFESPPDPKEPSNRMTVGRDEGDPRTNSSYPERSNPIYNPLNLASQVAGGAQWIWDNLYEGINYWRHDKEQLHYDQPMWTIANVLKDIQEFVECNRKEYTQWRCSCGSIDCQGTQASHDPSCWSEVDMVGVECSRLVEHMAQNKSLTGWGLPKHDSAPAVLPESFFPPEVQMNHESAKNVSMENGVMTKAQDVPPATNREDMPGNQGSGFARNKGTDYPYWNNLLQSMVSQPTFAGGFTSQCTMVPGWNVKEYPGQGLFATDCTSDTSKCWVTGAFDHEDWQHTNSTLVLESTNQGSSWNASVSSLGNFLHGLGIGGEKNMSVGGGGSVYNISQNSFTNVTGYPKYLYDVAGSVGVGYFAGGTSEAAYSKNGSLWKTLNIKDGSPESYAYGRPGVGCGADDSGDYGPYYPRGCVPYNYQEGGVPANCGEPGLPQCCCEDDTDTHTPACTGCWGWNYNSIWGADCNSFGDCMMTGDGVWSARKQEMLACSNKPVERDMRNCMTGVWWKNKKPKLNYCTGPGKVGNCLTWSAAYPGKDIAYISLGGRADVYYARTDPEKGKGDGGGGIVKSTNGGLDWVQQAIPSGLVTSLRGIDCFSETDCIAVGTNGVILRTTNGATWDEYWKDSQEIKDAKATNVQFLGVAYPNKNTVIAVGYIPKPPDGAVDKGVIYTLGEKEVCTEPPDEPDDPGESGDPDNPGDTGNPEAYCNDGCQTCWSLQISADRGGFTVTNPGEGTWGDLHIQWKNNGNGNRYQIPGKETGRNTIRIDNPGCGDWEFDSRASGCQDQSRPGGNVPC